MAVGIMRVVTALIGLFGLAMGLMFLVNPGGSAADFALSPIGSQGFATLRADFPAFFFVAGIFALLGAWKASSEPLKVPILLYGIAFFGRTVSLVLDGAGPMAYPPMAFEAGIVVLLIVAQQVFRKA